MAIRNVFRACTIPHIREAPPKAETSSLKSMTLNKKSLPYLVSTNPISGLGIGHSHPVYIFPSIYLSIHLSIHLEIWRYRDTARERERERERPAAQNTLETDSPHVKRGFGIPMLDYRYPSTHRC